MFHAFHIDMSYELICLHTNRLISTSNAIIYNQTER
jgi:hypothetical protein